MTDSTARPKPNQVRPVAFAMVILFASMIAMPLGFANLQEKPSKMLRHIVMFKFKESSSTSY